MMAPTPRTAALITHHTLPRLVTVILPSDVAFDGQRNVAWHRDAVGAPRPRWKDLTR
jgi:hypothetical protein